MTKNEIITALFLSKDFDECINSRCPPYLKDDLKAEIALLMCEKEEDQLQKLHNSGQLRFFVVRVILNQLSRNGQFYKKFRTLYISPESMSNNNDDFLIELSYKKENLFISYPTDLTERIEKEQFEDKVVSQVELVYWYKRDLIKLYIQHGNLRAVAKITGIPFTSVHLAITEAKKEIKEKVCH